MPDHFDGQRYRNPWGGAPLKRLWDVLRWRLTERPVPWPLRLDDAVPNQLAGPLESGLAVTFVGHDTFLLQFPGGLNLLTDPNWSDRASPISYFGPRRVRAPALPFENLPPIHAVLLSHNHYDHLDLATLKRLERAHGPRIYAPLGHRRLLKEMADVVELDWWESRQHEQLQVTLTPAQHWSSRSLWDRNRSLWGGYFLGCGAFRLYFAGDTGYNDRLFTSIRSRLSAPTLSLLPIGIYEPRWFMGPQHMNPDDAVRAHLDLGSRQSLGMHFGTFPLANEGIDQPLIDLEIALAAHRLDPGGFVVPRFGQTLLFSV